MAPPDERRRDREAVELGAVPVASQRVLFEAAEPLTQPLLGQATEDESSNHGWGKL